MDSVTEVSPTTFSLVIFVPVFSFLPPAILPFFFDVEFEGISYELQYLLD